MKKSLLVVILAIVLVLAFSVSALAAEKVINNIGDLETAFGSANCTVKGNTLTLDGNVTLDTGDYLFFNLGKNDEITIDLSRYSITGNVEDAIDAALIIVERGTLIIEGNSSNSTGYIENTNEAPVIAVFKNGEVVLESGSIISAAEDGVGVRMVDGSFTMNGGEIIAAAEGGRGVTIYGGSFVINDGKIGAEEGGGMGIKIDEGSLTMKGGSIITEEDGIEIGQSDPHKIDLTFSGDFYIKSGCHGIYGEDIEPAKNVSIEFKRASGTIIGEESGALYLDAVDKYVELDMDTSSADVAIQNFDDNGYYVTTFADSLSSAKKYDLAIEVNFVPYSEAEVLAAITTGVGYGSVTQPYINGYTDGTFRPNNPITRAEASKILTIAGGKVAGANNAGYYNDILTSAWYAPYVSTMSTAGWLKGYPDGTFRPDNTITIAEFTAIVCRIKNVNAATGISKYTDLGGNWAEGYIKAAEQQGWLANFAAGKLSPNRAITRAEAVLMLNLATGRNTMTIATYGPSFSDVAATDANYDAILRASSTMQMQ